MASRKGKKFDIINWVECKVCAGWDLFENTGFAGEYSKEVVEKVTYICRVCKLDKWAENKNVEINELKDKLAEMSKLAVKMDELEVLVESQQLEIGELRCEIENFKAVNRIVELEKSCILNELERNDRLKVVELQVAEVLSELTVREKLKLNAVGMGSDDESFSWRVINRGRGSESIVTKGRPVETHNRFSILSNDYDEHKINDLSDGKFASSNVLSMIETD